MTIPTMAEGWLSWIPVYDISLYRGARLETVKTHYVKGYHISAILGEDRRCSTGMQVHITFFKGGWRRHALNPNLVSNICLPSACKIAFRSRDTFPAPLE